ncbi:PAS domain S-box-containing protein [Massilia sp. MP_M2]|uniref:sensor histidine kinase n=1 Tax=Massilia sp. MP_M2 TaxID=3071713 RepID=UPI00319DF7FE
MINETPTAHRPISASLPPDEARRHEVLLELNLLDTPPQAALDRITRMATHLFKVPIALVSLIDTDRQWFKSRVGLALTETPRSASFCAHAILQDDVMVVRDARADARFADNPLVRGETAARFYAGSPIDVGDGVRIGTLCIIDSVPREFSDADRAMLRDLAGMVAGEIATIELRAACERERDGARALRALLEHLPDAVLLLDAGGRVLSCNPAAEKLFGVPGPALVGHASTTLIGMAPQVVSRHEGTAHRADGSPFAAEISIAEMPLDGHAHLVATVRDVDSLRAERERVRSANQRRHDYFRTASHELRTPMASILGFSELLLKREFDAATGRELIDIIHRQATRLIGLVNQMLDLARIDAGGAAQLRPTLLDLADLMARIKGALADEAHAARIALEVAPGLPPVTADAARVQQALTNIVSNALAYSAPDSVVDVHIAQQERAGQTGAAVRVRDQGVGMTPEQRKQIYDAFWRANALPDVPGNGLGMTIVREIVTAHGGVIEIVSSPGDGTEVALWLPARADTGSEAAI